ncbi:MAG: hypothetical protein GY898_17975 [Proteobacteria bacterium]|nr:hypothetical protein [Pseudomonadota bacterium]
MRSLLALTTLICALMAAPLVQAQSRGEEEARRQLEFAQQEVDEGNFEKALASADSALRLYPSLYEAYVFKALAYEGLGKLKMAESFLLTYRELRPGKDEQADEALARIQEKLGRGAEPAEPTEPPEETGGGSTEPTGGGGVDLSAVDLSGMPELPSGSEEFLSWLVVKQQVDTYETRKNVGAGLTAGGLGLAGAGVGLMVAMSLASANNPNDANVEAIYAAGVGSVLAGGTLAAVGLPTLIVNASQLGKLKKEAASASLEVSGPGLSLRF